MFRGLYLGASGMLAAQHLNDVVADNLANVNTPGYKKDIGTAKTFSQELMLRLEGGEPGTTANNSAPIGLVDLGVVIDRVTTGFSAGSLVSTHNSTDLALAGQGFFSVSTPEGVKYTRSGNFQLDGAGNLVTSQGYKVMGTQGPVSGLTSDNFAVSSDGTITQNGQAINRLAIVDFPTGALRKGGDNLFTSQSIPLAGKNYNVKQKFLEQSNVDVAQEMGAMMTALRSYEANQKVIQTLDNNMEKAANEIGKL